MSSVLVEADLPVATGFWRMLSTQIPADNPSRCSLAFIHHVINMLLIAELLLNFRSSSGYNMRS